MLLSWGGSKCFSSYLPVEDLDWIYANSVIPLHANSVIYLFPPLLFRRNKRIGVALFVFDYAGYGFLAARVSDKDTAGRGVTLLVVR